MNTRARADDSVAPLRERVGHPEPADRDSGVKLRDEGQSDARDASASVRGDTERLGRVTSAIADAVTADQVYEAIVDLAGEAVGASSGALWLREDDVARATLVRAFGYEEGSLRLFSTLDFEDACRFPALDAITQAESIFVDSHEELHRRYPHLSASTSLRGRRIACLPVIVEGRTLGGLEFTFDHVPGGVAEERRFLELAARYSGQAIERLRLLEAERRRRARAEAAAARMAVLNRASRLFSESSASLASLLATVAEQIALEGADACAVVLFGDADLPGSVAVYPPGEAMTEVAEALSSGAGLSPELAPGSYHVVPMTARGKQIGVICASRAERRGAFTEAERTLVVELAERAALVVERALLHEATRLARQRAELLYGLARIVIAAETPELVIEAALDAIERAVSADRSAVLLSDADGVLRFRASRGLSEAYRAAVEGHSPWPKDVRSPEPVLVPDVATSPLVARLRAVIESEGIRALAFIPLMDGARLIGKFMVYYDHPRALSSQELEIASAIANHVASAITRLYAVTELRQTVRFNEMFTAILGHDLRNPLGAIMTAAQLAMKRFDDERLQKPLGRIVNSGQRMARMIDQLLDFTRVRVGGGLPLSPHRFDVLPLLRLILDEVEAATPGFRSTLVSTGDTTGEWDSDRLGQVFSNLVGNAAQHGTPGAGARVRVDGTESNTLRVDVLNAGVIPRELVAKLFDPMTGGQGRREKSQGLGLGLYITKQIVRAHGGAIEVGSSDAVETSFRVVLPRVCPRTTGAGQ